MVMKSKEIGEQAGQIVKFILGVVFKLFVVYVVLMAGAIFLLGYLE